MHKPWCIWITVTKFCTNPLYYLADFLYLQNVVKKFSYQQHYLLVSCAHWPFSVKTFNIFPVMVSVGILSFGCTKLWFLLISCEDKWFILLEHATAATAFANHSFNIWTFLCVSTRQCPGSSCSQNGCTAAVSRDAGLYRTAVLYPRKKRTLWTPELKTVIVRLRTSRYWVVVQLYRLCDFAYGLISQ